jgi:hypothetical protein
MTPAKETVTADIVVVSKPTCDGHVPSETQITLVKSED